VAVDVDIENQLWAINHLNDTDTKTMWQAYNHKIKSAGGFPKLPSFPNVGAPLINNGSFSGISKKENHMRIPKLNLLIANLHDSIHNREQEPFLRVSNAYGKTDTEMQSIVDTEWSSQSDKKLVMRTAVFGYSTGSYSNPRTMCVKGGTNSGLFGKDICEDPRRPHGSLCYYRGIPEEGVGDRAEVDVLPLRKFDNVDHQRATDQYYPD
jgi:hypothetical protein